MPYCLGGAVLARGSGAALVASPGRLRWRAVDLRRAGVCLAPARWPDAVARTRIAARSGRRRATPGIVPDRSAGDRPAYLRPAILLPVGCSQACPTEQVEYILIHELAHIARRDYLVNVLQSLVEALLFYHPAVWWVSGVIRAEREHCCDDVVVALRGRCPRLRRRASETGAGKSARARARRYRRQPVEPCAPAATIARAAECRSSYGGRRGSARDGGCGAGRHHARADSAARGGPAASCRARAGGARAGSCHFKRRSTRGPRSW